jgi:hypothetical protein
MQSSLRKARFEAMSPRHVYPPSVLAEIFEESCEPKTLPMKVKTKARSYESRRLPSGCILINLKKTPASVEEQPAVFKRIDSN